MNRRIPTWIAMAASGVLVAASALAQGQGTAGANAQTSTDTSAAASSTDTKASTKTMRHASAKHAKKHAKMRKSTTSAAGTAAASGDRDLNAAMAQCADKTDRRERADCARQAWESRRGA